MGFLVYCVLASVAGGPGPKNAINMNIFSFKDAPFIGQDDCYGVDLRVARGAGRRR